MTSSRLGAKAPPLLLTIAVSIASAQYIEDSVDVGGACVGSMAYNSRENVVYGASETGSLVFALDCATNRVISRIPVQRPLNIVYDSLDNKAYVTVYNSGSCDSVLVIDGHTHERLRMVPVRGATDLVWDRISNRVYVSCDMQWDVKVLDCRTDSVITTIRTGDGPLKMHINPRRRKLYVQNYDEGTVAVVDMTRNEVTKLIAVGVVFMSGCYDVVADRYWVGMHNRVSVIDCATDSVVATLPTGVDQWVTALVADGAGKVMAGVYGANVLLTKDSYSCSTLVQASIGREPRGATWNADRSRLYIANGLSRSVSVLTGDGANVVGELGVSAYPFVFAYSPATARLFLGHLDSRWVYVIGDSTTGVADGPGDPQRLSGYRLSASPFKQGVWLEQTHPGGPGTDACVYSAIGLLLRRLRPVAGSVSSGYSLYWDGLDEQGREAPAGVYLFAPAGMRSAGVRGVKLR
jgi:DNA-binding beta-propeller fold protein YncE